MGSGASISYAVRPSELTAATTRLPTTAKAACCDNFYAEKDGKHGPSGKITQAKFNGGANGETDSCFCASIVVDGRGPKKAIHVNTRLSAKNATSDTDRYPGTIPINQEELEPEIKKIPSAIMMVWNSRPYKLKTLDKEGCERIFEVKFNVEFAFPHHYQIDFVNVKLLENTRDFAGGTSYISWVDQKHFDAKFNIAHPDSVTKFGGRKNFEAHEYGHMIGLLDEYDHKKKDLGGCRYEFLDESTEFVGRSKELMGDNSDWEEMPIRYCLTIAYAVVAIFAENGVKVTEMEIL